MRKIKVFHVISHFDIGGAEKVAFNIAQSQNPNIEYHIIEVVKVYSQFSDEFVHEVRNYGIKIHRSKICGNKLAIALFPWWFIWIYIRYKPSVIHTHTEIPDLSVYLFFRLFFLLKKTAIIRTIHNNELWNKWEAIGRHVEKFYQKYGNNIAISKSTQASYYKKYNQLCPIIYNGIGQPENRPFNGIVSGKINIVFAGRLEYQKGISVLEKIIHRLSNDNRYFFHIIGDGSLKDNLLQSLSVCSNFRYYDKIYNLADYLNAFDFLLLPSEFEGLALMPIEASFAGTPPIINDCPGLGEIMPEGWPLKVTNNDIEMYMDIFNTLKNFDYEKLQNSARNNALFKFSINRMQTEYEKLYLR